MHTNVMARLLSPPRVLSFANEQQLQAPVSLHRSYSHLPASSLVVVSSSE